MPATSSDLKTRVRLRQKNSGEQEEQREWRSWVPATESETEDGKLDGDLDGDGGLRQMRLWGSCFHAMRLVPSCSQHFKTGELPELR
ncbi:hypothetical protein ACFX10_008543 [Malus domestica]